MWLELQIFGFRALWSPYFLAFTIILAIIYFMMTVPFRKKFIQSSEPSLKQQMFFYSSLVLLYAVKGSPVDLLSHIMMSAHMVQMAILYFVIPILILRGLPTEWINKFIQIPVIKQIFRFFTIPLIALAVFNSMFAMYHLPAIFDFSKSSQLAHITITIILFIAAIFMWWPVITPIKKYDTLNPLIKMGYLIGSILMVTIACALIIFAKDPLFKAYSSEGAWLQSLSLCVLGDVLTGLSGDLYVAEMFSLFRTVED